MAERGGAGILVVEDDPATRTALEASFVGHGFAVRAAPDGRSALHQWELRRPDIVLLDLGLPDMDGIDLVRRIRREATTPILVLSARDQEREKVKALDLGADDYVTKPFGMAELWARVAALLRRAGGPAADPTGQVRIGALVVNASNHEVRVGDQRVPLTPREFELLRVLVSHAGHLVTRGRLLRAVWGTAYSDEAHYVHVYVSSIRRKIAAVDPSGMLERLILAEPGVGYRVMASEEAPTAEP
jgi:two-component system, OmpR family, KDP operon response regulator KdpE